jgi:hypothetical protein
VTARYFYTKWTKQFGFATRNGEWPRSNPLSGNNISACLRNMGREVAYALPLGRRDNSLYLV